VVWKDGAIVCEVSKLCDFVYLYCIYRRCIVWIDQVSIARPMVPDKDRTARERRVFPFEVFYSDSSGKR
jgi:hypothetical protein